MLYSPPEKSFSKIGSVVVPPYGRMYSVCAWSPNDMRADSGWYQVPSRFVDTKFSLPPTPAKSKPMTYRVPADGKSGWLTVLKTILGEILPTLASPFVLRSSD